MDEVLQRNFWDDDDDASDDSILLFDRSAAPAAAPAAEVHMFRVEVPVALPHLPPQPVADWVEAQCAAVKCAARVRIQGLREAVSRPGRWGATCHASTPDEPAPKRRKVGRHAPPPPQAPSPQVAAITPSSIDAKQLEAYKSKRQYTGVPRARPPVSVTTTVSQEPAPPPSTPTRLMALLGDATDHALRSSQTLRALRRVVADILPSPPALPPIPTAPQAPPATPAPAEEEDVCMAGEAPTPACPPAQTSVLEVEVLPRLLNRIAPRHALSGAAPGELCISLARYGAALLPPTALSHSCGACACLVSRRGASTREEPLFATPSSLASPEGGADRTPPRLSFRTPATPPATPPSAGATSHLVLAALLRNLPDPVARPPGHILTVDVTTTVDDVDAVRECVLTAFSKTRTVNLNAFGIRLTKPERDAVSAAVFAAYPDTAVFFEPRAAHVRDGREDVAFVCGLAAGEVVAYLESSSADPAAAPAAPGKKRSYDEMAGAPPSVPLFPRARDLPVPQRDDAAPEDAPPAPSLPAVPIVAALPYVASTSTAVSLDPDFFAAVHTATGCAAAAAQHVRRTKLWCTGRVGTRPPPPPAGLPAPASAPEPLNADLLRGLPPKLCWVLTAARRVGLARVHHRGEWLNLRRRKEECITAHDVYESAAWVDLIGVGDLVKLRHPHARTNVRVGEVGEVTATSGNMCTVRFSSDAARHWHGLAADLQLHFDGDDSAIAGAWSVGLLGTPAQRAAAVAYLRVQVSPRIEFVPLPSAHRIALRDPDCPCGGADVRYNPDGVVIHGPPLAARLVKSYLRNSLLYAEAQTAVQRWAAYIAKLTAAPRATLQEVAVPVPEGFSDGWGVPEADLAPTAVAGPRVPKNSSAHRASSLLLWTRFDDYCAGVRRKVEALGGKRVLANPAAASLGAPPNKPLSASTRLHGIVPRAGDWVRVFDVKGYREVVLVDGAHCYVRKVEPTSGGSSGDAAVEKVKVMTVHLPAVDPPCEDTHDGPFADPRSGWDKRWLSSAGVTLPPGLNDGFPPVGWRGAPGSGAAPRTPARMMNVSAAGDREWWSATVCHADPPTEASETFPRAVKEWLRAVVRGGSTLGRPTLITLKAYLDRSRTQFIIACPYMDTVEVDPCIPASSDDRLDTVLSKIASLKWCSLIDEYLFEELRQQLVHVVCPEHHPHLQRACAKAQYVLSEMQRMQEDITGLINAHAGLYVSKQSHSAFPDELKDFCRRQLDEAVREWRRHVELTAYELTKLADTAARAALRRAQERSGDAFLHRIVADAEVLATPRGGTHIVLRGARQNVAAAAQRLRQHVARRAAAAETTVHLHEGEAPPGEAATSTSSHPAVGAAVARLAANSTLRDVVQNQAGLAALEVTDSPRGLMLRGGQAAVADALCLLGLHQYITTTAEVEVVDACSICRDGEVLDVESPSVVMLGCGHVFRHQCFVQAVAAGDACPVEGCGYRMSAAERTEARLPLTYAGFADDAARRLEAAELPTCPVAGCGRHFAPPFDYPQRCPDCLGGTPQYTVRGWEGHVTCAACGAFPLLSGDAFTCTSCLFVQLCGACAQQGCGNAGHRIEPLALLPAEAVDETPLDDDGTRVTPLHKFYPIGEAVWEVLHAYSNPLWPNPAAAADDGHAAVNDSILAAL
eukprot:TRINITY_DN11512_c0_g1_i1.p1 TRINITY_DN11512_c0_g1~~TRINITY_DN11512_c0_g1_i1.p1  ORF type:complete len:1645 (+),score=415.43 TRINITY_DN11512_c0_g1_i1:85-5019(+)